MSEVIDSDGNEITCGRYLVRDKPSDVGCRLVEVVLTGDTAWCRDYGTSGWFPVCKQLPGEVWYRITHGLGD